MLIYFCQQLRSIPKRIKEVKDGMTSYILYLVTMHRTTNPQLINIDYFHVYGKYILKFTTLKLTKTIV